MTTAALRKSDRDTVVIRPGGDLSGLDLGELWRARGLLHILTLRELKLRYKQTVIGVAWALVQPLLAAAIFTVIFGYFAKMPSGDIPYPVFALSAVLPWTYFAEAVRRSSTGLVSDAELIRKVYFPRLIIPLAMVLSPLADFAVGLLLLVALCAWYGIAPSATLVFLPVFLVMAIALALSISLWLGPLSVRFRDVMHTLPFLILGLIVIVLMFFAALPVGLGFLVLFPVLAGTLYASYQDVFVAH